MYFAGSICTGAGCRPYYPIIFWYIFFGFALLFISGWFLLKFWRQRNKGKKNLLVGALIGLIGLGFIFLPNVSTDLKSLKDNYLAKSIPVQLYEPTYRPAWIEEIVANRIVNYGAGQKAYQKVYSAHDGGFLLSEYSNKGFEGSEKDCRASNPQWDVLPKAFLSDWKCEHLADLESGAPVYVLREIDSLNGSELPLHYFAVFGDTRISIKESRQQSQVLSTDEALKILNSMKPIEGNRISAKHQLHNSLSDQNSGQYSDY